MTVGQATEIMGAEMQCEHCGDQFRYEESRRCWMCDSLVCPPCMNEPPGELCPECRQKVATVPETIGPMLGQTGLLPESSEGWGFEFKWDGLRAVARWDGKRLRLESRNRLDMTFRYPELRDLGGVLGRNAAIDGEIVALDEHGRPSFSKLQQRMHVDQPGSPLVRSDIPIRYYIFDLLHLNGITLLRQTYERRRALLDELKIQHPFCRVPPSYRGEGRDILDVAREHGLEGIMCKRLGSPYLPGRRSGDWRKVKVVNTREFIIGGFKYGKSRRDRIGSLRLGAYDADLRLRFVGGAGTGFSGPDHQILLRRLEPIRVSENVFYDEIDRKDVVFVTPRYVAEVEYRRWPTDGPIQQAAYKGLRIDKPASDVLLEEP
jgi:bifunctional non-homologous end joining protein LigD